MFNAEALVPIVGLLALFAIVTLFAPLPESVSAVAVALSVMPREVKAAPDTFKPSAAVINPENVCVPAKLCAESVRAIEAEVLGKVIVVPSVPSNVSVLFAVSVFPLAIVSVALVAGVVNVILLMLVAVATPRFGVVNVGESLFALLAIAA